MGVISRPRRRFPMIVALSSCCARREGKAETSVKHMFFQRYAGGLVLLTAFLLRVWNLGGPSLWYDEAYLWWATTQLPFSKMVALSLGELVPPLHYFALRTWLPLAGTSEFALRYPSALSGMLALAAMSRIARRLTGRRNAAFWALFLGAFATALIWASRETRMYGAFIGWSLLAGMALIETLHANHHRAMRRWAWLWGGATLGAMSTLTLSAFWLIGQGLFAFMTLTRRPRTMTRAWLRAMLPPALGAGLIFLPWVLGAWPSLGANATYWEGHLPIPEFLRIAITGMTVSDYLTTEWKFAAGSLILLMATFVLILAYQRPHAGLYPFLQLLPMGAMALIFRNLPKWGSRHASMFAPLPVLMLAIGWGLATGIQSRAARIALRLGLGLCTLLSLTIYLKADINLLTNPAFAAEDWRSAARFVAEHRTPGDVIIIETGSVFPAWAYYAGFENLLPLPDDELLDVTNVLDYTKSATALNAALKAAPKVWLVTWLEHITDPTGIVPALLSELGPELSTPNIRGLGLRQFVIEESPAFAPTPALTAQLEQSTLPNLTLWGYRLPEDQHHAGVPFDLWTFWTTENPSAHEDRFYQVVLQLLDAQGNEWARHNDTPGSGDYRPSRWKAGTPVLGRYPVTPDPWTPPGIYTPTVTVYIAGGDTATVILRPITLVPATTPPTLPQGFAPVESAGAELPTAPLRLLGLTINREVVLPCDQIVGWAYWETSAPYAAAERADILRAVLDEHSMTLPVAVTDVVLSWPAGTRFATQFHILVSCRALDTAAPLGLELHAADGELLERWYGPEIRIAAGREFSLPTGLLPAKGDFGPGFTTLEGYSLEPKLHAGQPFTITLYWRAEQTGDTPYSVFVHVVPPDAPGPLVAQHDSWPALGTKPTNTWAHGEIVADPHPLPGLPAGIYHLRIGLYDANERLQVMNSAASALKDTLSISMTVAP